MTKFKPALILTSTVKPINLFGCYHTLTIFPTKTRNQPVDTLLIFG